MKNANKIVLSASVLAASMASLTITESQAAFTGTSAYVERVDLDFRSGTNYVSVINSSNSKNVNQASLALGQTTIEIPAFATLKCTKDKKVDPSGAKIYFGPIGMGGLDNINASSALHSANYDFTSIQWTGLINGWITEGVGPNQNATIPLDKIKNGHPAVRFDPVAEINKKLQSHLQGGGTKLDFFQNDQTVTISRPISAAGWCKKDGLQKAGFRTKNYSFTIRYQGDKTLTNSYKVKPVLGGNGQINNDFPFKLDKADIMANIPHYVGKCVPATNPKIRINFQGSGSKKGVLALRVKAVSNTYADYGYYYQTSGILNDPKVNSHLDFSFPLKEILSQGKYSYMAISNNKTYSHNMRVEARYKNAQNGTWSSWTQMDTAVFKHRCTPQVVVPAGKNKSFAPKNSGPKINSLKLDAPVVRKPKRLAPSAN